MKTLAQIAYEAYGDSVDWRNHLGLGMPRWELLPDKIQNAWANAVNAAHEEASNR